MVPRRNARELTIHVTMATPSLIFAAILIVVAASGLHAGSARSAERSDLQREQAERRAKKAQAEFDAVTLQALIAPMFSGTKNGPFGSGSAGRYWQSLMTEHIARKIASSGRLRLLTSVPDARAAARGKNPISNDKQRWGVGKQAAPAPALLWHTSVRAAGRESAENIEQSK